MRRYNYKKLHISTFLHSKTNWNVASPFMKFAIHNLCTFQVIHNTICIHILLTKRSTIYRHIFGCVFRGIDIDFSIWQYLPGRYHHTIYIIVILVYCSPDSCNDNSLLMLSYAIIVSSLYYIQIMILREPKRSF